MYGLKKIAKDGVDKRDNFIWPLEIGVEVEAPTWNRESTWNRGLACMVEARGMFGMTKGEYWAVLEFDEKDVICVNSLECKIKKCKIVFLSEDPEGILQFFDWNNFNSETAYQWAYYIGDREKMINKITEPEWAYFWASNIGNREIMATKIKTDHPYSEMFKWLPKEV